MGNKVPLASWRQSSSSASSKFLHNPQLGTARPGIGLYFPRGRYDGLSVDQFHHWLPAADAHRKSRWTGALPQKFLEIVLHEAIFQRMEGDHGQPAPGLQQGNCLPEHIGEGTELIVDRDAQR